ncbi:MAG TPA: cell division protein FtsL [Xanthomonadales bacterium]|nr:cell division protein FtsL [Xanthomonadales bacterium]
MNARLLMVVIMLGALIGTALGVVYTRHESRRTAVQFGELENRRDDLVAEWSRLQLEQAWLADAGQVESKARDHLGMGAAENPKILVIKP